MNDNERNRRLTEEDAQRNMRLAKTFEPLDRFEIPHVSVEDTDDELLQAAVRLINHFGGFYDVQLAPNGDIWDAIRLVRREAAVPIQRTRLRSPHKPSAPPMTTRGRNL